MPGLLRTILGGKIDEEMEPFIKAIDVLHDDMTNLTEAVKKLTAEMQKRK